MADQSADVLIPGAGAGQWSMSALSDRADGSFSSSVLRAQQAKERLCFFLFWTITIVLERAVAALHFKRNSSGNDRSTAAGNARASHESQFFFFASVLEGVVAALHFKRNSS